MSKTIHQHSDTECSKQCDHCGATYYRDKRNTWKYWRKARFCSRNCFGAFDAARKIRERLPKEQDFTRWFSKSQGCWEWQGALDKDGYGIFSYAGKVQRAARFALALDGRDPKRKFACHTCDNPSCVNPSHLFVGSHEENMADMVAKGRHWKVASK